MRRCSDTRILALTSLGVSDSRVFWKHGICFLTHDIVKERCERLILLPRLREDELAAPQPGRGVGIADKREAKVRQSAYRKQKKLSGPVHGYLKALAD